MAASIYIAFGNYKAGSFKVKTPVDKLLEAGFGWVKGTPEYAVRLLGYLEILGAIGVVLAPIAAIAEFSIGKPFAVAAAAAGCGRSTDREPDAAHERLLQRRDIKRQAPILGKLPDDVLHDGIQIGGGMVMVPFMTLYLDYKGFGPDSIIKVAIATSLASILFIVAGFAFKVSAVPFQFWAPDTYEGAPTPVTATIAPESMPSAT